MSDTRFMRQALRLAARGDTSPNPRVGCVITSQDGRVLATGYHQRVGMPHAEVEALRRLNFSAPGATLYVNLEPCAHHGRTPPCVEAILRAGIRRVVAGMTDPNPLVQGRGFQRLRDAGIEVVQGVLEADCLKLNEGFCKAITTGLPFVTLKQAASLDGKIATHTRDARWISSAESRSLVHHWRDLSDAVVVGVETVLQDNPQLTVRLAKQRTRRPPLRVVLDTHLRTPLDATVLNSEAPSLLLVGDHIEPQRLQTYRDKGIELQPLPLAQGRLSLPHAFVALYQRGVVYAFVEPGATLADALWRSGLVDRAYYFLAPRLIGGQTSPTLMGGMGFPRVDESISLHWESYRKVGDDLLVEVTPRPRPERKE